MSRVFRSRTRTFAVAAKRMGERFTILRADGSAVENEYGKIEDDDRDFEPAGEEYGIPWYRGRDDYSASASVEGGRVNTDNPWFYVREDTAVEEDDRIRVEHSGRVYVVNRLVDETTHKILRVTLVNE